MIAQHGYTPLCRTGPRQVGSACCHLAARRASFLSGGQIEQVLLVVVVVVLTLTRIFKSVVTGQAPVTLELRNTPGKTHTQPKVVHACITADAIHASTRNI